MFTNDQRYKMFTKLSGGRGDLQSLDGCDLRRGTNVIKTALYSGILLCAAALSGCSFSGGPRARIGYLPTHTFGVVFADPNHLGTHGYSFGASEAGGIVYTCCGGHLDLDHVRGNADLTRYLVGKVRKTLSDGKTELSFSQTGETSTHLVTFTYPQDWQTRADKEKIIDDISYEAGPYLAFNATIWHEILTWFGVHFIGFEPEFNSAFSWEDIYSNLVGVRLGVEAMKDPVHDYDQAMTIALQRQLKELQVQPKSTALYASDKVRGKWYTGNFIPDTKMRNFDIGLDGTVTPTLVEGIPGCDCQPRSLPAPTLEKLRTYGFSMLHEVNPNVFEQGRIYKAAQSKWIFPAKHYPVIMEAIKKQAAQKGYLYDE